MEGKLTLRLFGIGFKICRVPQTYLPLASVPKPCHLQSAIRFVHNTNKKHHTSLITSDVKHLAFHKMSLNALKNECRSRGLKVSGKKAELVDRITSYQGSTEEKAAKTNKRKISSSQLKRRSLHTSKIVDLNVKQRVMQKQMSETTPEAFTLDAIDQKSTLTSSTGEAPNNHDRAFEFEKATGTMAANKINLNDTVTIKENLTTKDKTFLLLFGTLTGIWWSSQYMEEKGI